MTDKEKIQKISVAYNNIKTVMEDTNDNTFAYMYLLDVILALDSYFEMGIE